MDWPAAWSAEKKLLDEQHRLLREAQVELFDLDSRGHWVMILGHAGTMKSAHAGGTFLRLWPLARYLLLS